MNAFEEFPEGYEPTPLEILLQANRRVRFHDRRKDDTITGSTDIRYDNGHVNSLEFYKPTEYEYEGVVYNVVFSHIDRDHYDDVVVDLVITLLLKDPNEEEYLVVDFVIFHYGTIDEYRRSPVSPAIKVDNLEDMILYESLYPYAMSGVAKFVPKVVVEDVDENVDENVIVENVVNEVIDENVVIEDVDVVAQT
jgi:hypothetical protein